MRLNLATRDIFRIFTVLEHVSTRIKIKVMKELDYYMYQFSDGIVAPYELEGKIIVGIWKVYQKLNK